MSAVSTASDPEFPKEDMVEITRGRRNEAGGELELCRMAHLERLGVVHAGDLRLHRGNDVVVAVAGVHTPQTRGSVKDLPPVVARVVHAFCANQHAGIGLELPVRRERLPQRVKIVGVRIVGDGGGHRSGLFVGYANRRAYQGEAAAANALRLSLGSPRAGVYRVTGPSIPFMPYLPASLNLIDFPVHNSRTILVTNTPSVSAASQTRAAICTVDPNRSLSSTMGSPALMPMRMCRGSAGHSLLCAMHPLQHDQGRLNRLMRMAEPRHDPVAGMFHLGTAVILQRHAHDRVVGPNNLLSAFVAEFLGDFRRPNDIGEEHKDRAVILGDVRIFRVAPLDDGLRHRAKGLFVAFRVFAERLRARLKRPNVLRLKEIFFIPVRKLLRCICLVANKRQRPSSAIRRTADR